MTTFIRNFVHSPTTWIWVFLATLVGTRIVNISRLLGEEQVTNYVDITVRLSSICVLGFAVWVVCTWFESRPWLTIFGILYGAFWEVMLLLQGYENWWHGIERASILIVLIWSILQIVRYRTRLVKTVTIGILLLPFFFDHFLVSDPMAAIMLAIVGLICAYSIPLGRMYYGLMGISIVQLGVGLYQVIAGRSAGLYFIGESVLSTSTRGIATMNILGGEVLRGYGLFAHPNIYGFFGGILLVCACVFNGFRKIVLVSFGVGIIVLSGSRSAFIGAAILGVIIGGQWVVGMLSSKMVKRVGVVLFGLLTVGLVLLQWLVRAGGEDRYRMFDVQKFATFYAQLPYPAQYVFGIGTGQYPFGLMVAFPQLEAWNLEPVHNTLLLLIAEFGLVPVSCGIGLIISYTFQKLSHKKLPLNEKLHIFSTTKPCQ
jgi:hypothetical protein